MKLLYVSYWGVSDPLFQATVLPNLKILQSFDFVKEIWVSTIEREVRPPKEDGLPKGLRHIALYARNIGFTLLDRGLDLFCFTGELRKLIETEHFGLIIARSSMAGSLVFKAAKSNSIPIIIESFEPHAAYMLESGIWHRWDPRYLFQTRKEIRQKQHATGLITVANNYKEQLVKEGYSAEKISVAPCPVDQQQFAYDTQQRNEIRDSLGISDDTLVGIYVGKFGGIYWDDEALQLFGQLNELLDNRFHMIILSNQEGLESRLSGHGLHPAQVTARQVQHHEVAAYLSAADVAFATIKSTPHRKFCSAIKIAEYWANGLPIMIPEGIGDDTDIIRKANAGVIIHENTPLHQNVSIDQLKKLTTPEKRQAISGLATRWRDLTLTRDAYQYQFDRIERGRF